MVFSMILFIFYTNTFISIKYCKAKHPISLLALVAEMGVYCWGLSLAKAYDDGAHVVHAVLTSAVLGD